MKIHRLHARRPRTDRSGFSLAELMVVIVILGLLATVVVPNVVGYLGKASDAVAKADLTAISGAVENFRLQNGGRLPDSLEQLIEEDDTGSRYLDMDELIDPWGNDYVFEPDFDGAGDYLVVSYGKDGQAGGEGEDEDISHRDAKKRKRR